MPDVEFVEHSNSSHGHRVIKIKSVGQAVDVATTGTDAWVIIDISHALRKEVLSARDQKFTSDFSDYESTLFLKI